jgi:Type I restriction enzyme R protein N terminus (HSDR_N).
MSRKAHLLVKEALMLGNTESDYLLFVDDKAIAVVEAKREENPLGEEVQQQAEDYACNPQDWYGLWFPRPDPAGLPCEREKNLLQKYAAAGQ